MILNIRFFCLLLVFGLLSLAASAQQDPRDEFYSPPANSKYLKAASGNSKGTYEGDYTWALRFYPARLWYTTSYFGFERSLTKSFSVSLDAGWHATRAGMSINALGANSSFDDVFDGPSVFSTQSYANLLVNGTQLTNVIPTVGFSARIFTQEKEGHNVPFIQFQYQFTQANLLMKDYGQERFAGANDTATLQLHTAMLRVGRQWTYGKKVKILNEISIGIGANMRVSSAYESVGITVGNDPFGGYFLNSLTGETARIITPRFQFAYSIGIAY